MDNSSSRMLFSPPLTKQVDVDWKAEDIRAELRQAVLLLGHHCLKLSAKWASEQLIGLPLCGLPEPASLPEATNLELYAKTLLELGEYAHAAAMLSEPNTQSSTVAPPLPDLSTYGVYLRSYALYMAGEQRKNQDMVELQEEGSKVEARNPHLEQLVTELEDYYTQSDGKLSAMGLYVYGLVLKEYLPKKHKHSPHSILIQSIRAFPCNWSAWQDLASLDIDFSIIEDALQEELGSHYMYHFFCAHVYADHQSHEQAVVALELLIQPSEGYRLFASSPYIATKLAVAHYHLREFHLAEHIFSQVHQMDPYRLEELDIYSNILFVQDNKKELSKLAHTASAVDKYRPETCCIIGNYYSLKNQRTKAIRYFQRALKLDRSYTGAWTLMGHEYVELKNTPAAMEAYRRAADLNPKDYRAWYGLGQAYEFLQMPLYALFYYRKAASLRAYDARMWCSVGNCYLALGKRGEAIKSYERAVSYQDHEGIATSQLAAMYKQQGQEEKAAQCYLNFLELRHLATTAHPSASPTMQEVLQAVVVQSAEAPALLFLAHYHVNHQEFDTAALCASRLLEYPGPEKEEGKALLREIRSRSATNKDEAYTVASRVQESRRPPTRRRQEDSPAARGGEGEFSVDFSP
jgi:anaphase-promoting complex subunit 8